MTKWALRFLEMSVMVADWSKDPSTKCGCVIAKGKEVVSTGFNGYPSGIVDNPDDTREIKLAKTIHAEVNAILYAKQELCGCTLYITPIPPCSSCAAIIAQTGISKVIVGIRKGLDLSRWQKSIDIGNEILRQKSVIVMEVQLD